MGISAEVTPGSWLFQGTETCSQWQEAGSQRMAYIGERLLPPGLTCCDINQVNDCKKQADIKTGINIIYTIRMQDTNAPQITEVQRESKRDLIIL